MIGRPGFSMLMIGWRRDDLERVKVLIDFEIFRPALETAVARADCSKQAVEERGLIFRGAPLCL